MTSSPLPQNLPPISTLPALYDLDLCQILDLLFEPAPEIHVLCLPVIREYHSSKGPFPNYETFIRTVGDKIASLCSSPVVEEPEGSKQQRQHYLHAILGSHPRLGAPKVHSAQSAAEQANLQSTSGSDAQDLANRLRDLNAEYEARFPGLRYVVFVNGRGRPEIMADMRARIDEGDIRAEEKRAVAAMVDIALDRAGKLEARGS